MLDVYGRLIRSPCDSSEYLRFLEYSCKTSYTGAASYVVASLNTVGGLLTRSFLFLTFIRLTCGEGSTCNGNGVVSFSSQFCKYNSRLILGIDFIIWSYGIVFSNSLCESAKVFLMSCTWS